MKRPISVATHLVAVAIGFALGIYLLPILIAPEGSLEGEVQSVAGIAEFTAEFRHDLEDSDARQWGEGRL